MERTMKTTLVALALTATVAGGLDAQEAHRLRGADVAIYNLAGRAEVRRGTGSEVVVRLARGGADAQRLDVVVGEIRGRETLRVIYPDDEVIYEGMGRGSNTNLRVRDDGTFGGGGGGERVRIRGSGRGLEAWADLVVEVPAGRSLSLNVAAGDVELDGVDGRISVDTGSGQVTATDMRGALSIDTGSGGVRVTGMGGDLLVDTGSGSVVVRDVAGRDVTVDTGSGRVTGSGIRADALRVDTGSGSIELDDVTSADVVLDTGSGSVDIGLTRDIDRLDIDTGSGSVTVRAPASLGADVEVDTGSGGIDVDFAVQVRTVRRDHLEGRIGDGQGRIRIDTGSGSIRLVRN